MTAQRVGPASSFPVGAPVFVSLVPSRERLMIVRTAEGLRALIDQCSHQGRSMAGGRIHDEVLRCPHHGICYDVATGKITWDAGYLGVFACEVVPVFEADGQVHVER